MHCHNHVGVEAVGTCSGCAESFCDSCLVTIKGERYCAECKGMAIPPSVGLPVEEECTEAKQALQYAIVGIFCLGIILEPLAISKALKARRQIREDPRLTGQGKATAALVIGIAALALWVTSIIARLK